MEIRAQNFRDLSMGQNKGNTQSLRELLLNGMGHRFYSAAVAKEKPAEFVPSDKKFKSLVKHEPR